MAIRFEVTNNVPGITTNHVFVFLKPVDAKNDYQYYAWQDLNPADGSTAPFDFDIDISVAVADQRGTRSRPEPIRPGQRFTALNTNGQSPKIQAVDIGGVTPDQAGLLNDCSTPNTNIAVNWYNKGISVVTAGLTPPDIINVGKTSTFELQPSLYFVAADPTIVGPNYTLQVYSNATEYKLSASSSVVKVSWYRDVISGQDKFKFDPPSRSMVAGFVREPQGGSCSCSRDEEGKCRIVVRNKCGSNMKPRCFEGDDGCECECTQK